MRRKCSKPGTTSATGMGSRSKLLVPILAMLALAVGVSACGSSDDSTTGGGSGSSESGDLPGQEVSDAELKETIKKAFFADVPESELTEPMVNALKVASVPLTSKQEAKLTECIGSNECDTGTGGDLTLGIADPFGGIPWRVQARIEATAQALAYPQVGKIIYTDGNADEQKALANFKSLMAQNVDVITGYFDFAASMQAMIKQANGQGIKVVPYIGPVPGIEPGVDMTADVVPDLCQTGKDMAKRAIEAGGKNEAAAVFTGIPGNSSKEWQDCATDEFEANGWSVPYSGTTEWTPQGEIAAASELIASGDAVDAVLYDNTGANLLVPYERQGDEPPVVISWANSLQYYKAYEKLPKGAVNFIINGQTWTPRPAVTAGIEAAIGNEVPGEVGLPQPIVDTSDALAEVAPTMKAGFPEGYTPPTFAPEEVVLNALE